MEAKGDFSYSRLMGVMGEAGHHHLGSVALQHHQWVTKLMGEIQQ